MVLCLTTVSVSRAGHAETAASSRFGSVVRARSDTVAVRLKAGQPLNSVLDLSCFWPFVPGMTNAAAERWYGRPAAVRRDYAGTYYEYDIRGTRLELADNTAQSTFGSARWWSLTCYPNTELTVTFRSDLVRLMADGPKKMTEVSVFSPGPGNCDVVHIALSDGIVKSMDWNPRACSPCGTGKQSNAWSYAPWTCCALSTVAAISALWFVRKRRAI